MIDLDKIESAARKPWHCRSKQEDNLLSPEVLVDLITRLRQAEKDAARYRWIKENGQLGVGRCGVDWELYFEGPAPDNSAMIERHIDEAMQCSK